MSKAVVLLNGQPPSSKLLHEQCKNADFVIAADGALNYCKEIKVDVVVGDFDSIDPKIVPLCQVIKLNCTKDETDGEVAIDAAVSRHHLDLVLLGALGKRFDHQMGNIQLLVRAAQSGCNAKAITDDCTIYVTCKPLTLNNIKGQTVSIIPFGINVEIASLTGFMYPLNDYLMPLGKTIGISNVATSDCSTINVRHGWAIVVVNNPFA